MNEQEMDEIRKQIKELAEKVGLKVVDDKCHKTVFLGWQYCEDSDNPGQWVVYRDYPCSEIHKKYLAKGLTREEARLIAAAPALLEAAKTVNIDAQKDMGKYQMRVDVHKMTALQNAILKAEEIGEEDVNEREQAIDHIKILAEKVGFKVVDEEEPQLESWHVEDGGNCQLTGQHCDLVSNKAGNLIAYVVAKYAKQVAAIPDLLEAAKKVAFGKCVDWDDMQALHYAIAKAEGKGGGE